MNGLAKYLAAGCELMTHTQVAGIDSELRLRTDADADLGRYRAALVSAPASQAVPLLTAAPALASAASRARMAPCWAAMASWEAPLPLSFDGAFIDQGALSWAARDAAKPERPVGERWVLHGAPAWSRQHLEESAEDVAPLLVAALAEAAGRELPPPGWVRAHRWRLARVEEPLGRDFLWDADLQLGACGDWCRGPRLEDALISGAAAAEAVLTALGTRA
jgi:predicted NAD/FAD-dependent oxidoreductase